jgi:S-adenosylmethionine-diacylglycerol 3-amino-3-carboxypropyl transferase
MKAGNDSASAEIEGKPASWVHQASQRPIAFAQVREDAALDQWVVTQLNPGSEILMIASGGCSAAAVAGISKVSRLHIIDRNPAQMALTRFKLHLLATAEPEDRLALLGHASMPAGERRVRLAGELNALNLPADALGNVDTVAEEGPDYAGRYEILFAKLRQALGGVAEELAASLGLRDPGEQTRRFHPATQLGQALDAAFDSVMSLPNLVGLFGDEATRNRCEPFSRHFARRTRHALATLPASDNPYLWQMLQGRFPDGVVYPWLSAPLPVRMPEIVWTMSGITEALDSRPEAFDFIHLSNILDWLTPEEVKVTLDFAWRALRPTGLAFIRQLNSTLNIADLGRCFEWDTASRRLHEHDRSFFYRELLLGRKK